MLVHVAAAVRYLFARSPFPASRLLMDRLLAVAEGRERAR